MLLVSSADFFRNYLYLKKVAKIEFFKKILSGTQSQCQTVWLQIRTDILSVLIWVQTVYKGYQQTSNVTAGMERAEVLNIY